MDRNPRHRSFSEQPSRSVRGGRCPESKAGELKGRPAFLGARLRLCPVSDLMSAVCDAGAHKALAMIREDAWRLLSHIVRNPALRRGWRRHAGAARQDMRPFCRPFRPLATVRPFCPRRGVRWAGEAAAGLGAVADTRCTQPGGRRALIRPPALWTTSDDHGGLVEVPRWGLLRGSRNVEWRGNSLAVDHHDRCLDRARAFGGRVDVKRRPCARGRSVHCPGLESANRSRAALRVRRDHTLSDTSGQLGACAASGPEHRPTDPSQGRWHALNSENPDRRFGKQPLMGGAFQA